MVDYIKIEDPQRVSYRIRILQAGQKVATFYHDAYQTAVDLAYGELEVRTFWAHPDKPLLAAVVESGIRFEGDTTMFIPNRQLREGLVRDRAILNQVDTKFLFGLT